jgi:3-hydroxymyristoyl/3-hydroxydecanoyl-(acyl carrier protein) dehydratase
LFWFRGHFPEFPILPGVVQLDWALAFAREFLGLAIESGQSFQVKFNQPIVPGDTIELALVHDQTRGRIRFSYMRGSETCSSGQVKVP